jgi:hypothetical protein
LVFDIDPGEIPGLAGKVDPRPLHFDLTERGRFDLARGRYHTNSDVLTIEDGAFAGLTILNCTDGEVSGGCESTLQLGVYVWSDTKSPNPGLDIPASHLPKEVWICPGTPVSLLWESKGADAVRIAPDLGELPPNGRQDIPDPTSPNPRLHSSLVQSKGYYAETVPNAGCPVAKDHVTINMIGSAGEPFPQTATYQDGTNYWVAYLPDHTYDSRILVTQVIIDDGRSDSVTHPSWRVDHLYNTQPPVGTTIPSLNSWVNTGAKHPLPGEYRFTPMPSGFPLPSGEHGRTIYFRLMVECGG